MSFNFSSWWKKLLEKWFGTATEPEPQPEPTYVVEVGKRVEKEANSLAFTCVPARDGSATIEDVVLWGYTGGDWHGGNPQDGHFSFRVKTNNPNSLELKVYDASGYVGEWDIACGWRVGQTYKIEVLLLADRVRLTVGGLLVESKRCVPPVKCTMGYGWPPTRKGALGAKITEVIWK